MSHPVSSWHRVRTGCSVRSRIRCGVRVRDGRGRTGTHSCIRRSAWPIHCVRIGRRGLSLWNTIWRCGVGRRAVRRPRIHRGLVAVGVLRGCCRHGSVRLCRVCLGAIGLSWQLRRCLSAIGRTNVSAAHVGRLVLGVFNITLVTRLIPAVGTGNIALSRSCGRKCGGWRLRLFHGATRKIVTLVFLPKNHR